MPKPPMPSTRWMTYSSSRVVTGSALLDGATDIKARDCGAPERQCVRCGEAVNPVFPVRTLAVPGPDATAEAVNRRGRRCPGTRKAPEWRDSPAFQLHGARLGGLCARHIATGGARPAHHPPTG